MLNIIKFVISFGHFMFVLHSLCRMTVIQLYITVFDIRLVHGHDMTMYENRVKYIKQLSLPWDQV